MAHELLDRAMPELKPPEEAYYRAVYIRVLTHYLTGEYDRALEAIRDLLESPDPNDCGQALALRAWVAAKRGDLRAHLNLMLEALNEYLSAKEPDQYGLAHTVETLAVMCRELAVEDRVIECVRTGLNRVRLSEATAFPRFQSMRLLGWAQALRGDEIAALRAWRDAQAAPPSEFWRVFCLVDRAYLSLVMGRIDAGTKILDQADRVASGLKWSETREEERLILITIAQLFSERDPGRSERYLALYRTLSSPMEQRIGWVGDPRARAMELYPQAVALLRLDESAAAIPMLEEAWDIFTSVEYGWRAALAALDLYKATGKADWLQRAREHIAPWPHSWVARDVRNAG
ncbi:MAG TPA: hypothetical protein VFN37_14400 [Candidatus Baltobacteraceae bacterium]|nr:hypothetical protein [Candidatus Baltobacteraceae bacterium]